MARGDLERVQLLTSTDAVYRSHGISAETAQALLAGDAGLFLRSRGEEIGRVVRDMAERLAGWDRNDRPSTQYVLDSVTS
jgi:hypothetical protein